MEILLIEDHPKDAKLLYLLIKFKLLLHYFSLSENSIFTKNVGIFKPNTHPSKIK